MGVMRKERSAMDRYLRQRRRAATCGEGAHREAGSGTRTEPRPEGIRSAVVEAKVSMPGCPRIAPEPLELQHEDHRVRAVLIVGAAQPDPGEAEALVEGDGRLVLHPHLEEADLHPGLPQALEPRQEKGAGE